MGLWDVREHRKKLGAGTRKGPSTWILVALLILVLVLIHVLDRVG